MGPQPATGGRWGPKAPELLVAVNIFFLVTSIAVNYILPKSRVIRSHSFTILEKGVKIV